MVGCGREFVYLVFSGIHIGTAGTVGVLVNEIVLPYFPVSSVRSIKLQVTCSCVGQRPNGCVSGDHHESVFYHWTLNCWSFVGLD